MRAKHPDSSGTVDRDGISLHYDIYGEGDTTIVFVPTWALVHSRVYKAQVPYFADHHRVITYDPRGNGMSGRPATPAGYAFDHLVSDIGAVLDATETERAVLVGFSFSSAVAFAYSAQHPERVLAVVSTGAWTPIVPPIDHDIDPRPGPDGKPQSWAKQDPAYWRQDYADFATFFLAEVNNEPHSTKQLEDSIAWAADGDGDMLAMTREGRDSTVDDTTYRSVRCPSLLVHARNDAITPF
ncbi:MAG: alpha/beta hydrolase, partial [Hyphomicrobiales bacterium]|nr:alpha/beta hydrolase [Hyphomicrobiales bacterium]